MQQVIPHVWTFSGLLLGRVYAIKGSDGLTLIDASIPGSGPKILKQLYKAGFKVRDVKRIMLTHAHWDHVGGLEELTKQTGAELIVPDGEVEVVEGKVPAPHADIASLHWWQRLMLPPEEPFPPVAVNRIIHEGDSLDDVMDGLMGIATPGHSPGHMVYWQPQQRIVFLGDVLMRMSHFQIRLPFRAFTIDMQQNIASFNKILKLEPEIVCFGHGQPLFNATAVLTKWAKNQNIEH